MSGQDKSAWARPWGDLGPFWMGKQSICMQNPAGLTDSIREIRVCTAKWTGGLWISGEAWKGSQLTRGAVGQIACMYLGVSPFFFVAGHANHMTGNGNRMGKGWLIYRGAVITRFWCISHRGRVKAGVQFDWR